MSNLHGASFEEAATVLAFLSPDLSSAADAGAPLKECLQRLLPMTTKQVAAMHDIGLITQNVGEVNE